MLGALAAFAAVIPFAQTTAPLFTREKLASAYDAYAQPETITVQAVYPANRGEKIERLFGSMTLRFVGKPIPLNPRLRTQFIANFAQPVDLREKICVFHPDHHIVFRRGAHMVEAITCFTCDELMVIADGRYLGRTSMGPPKQLRTILTATVPLEDTLRAATEEWLSREMVQALAAGPTGEAIRVRPPQGDPPTPKFETVGKAVRLSPDFVRSLYSALEVHSFNNRLSFNQAPSALPTATPPSLHLKFQSRPRVDLFLYGTYSRARLYVDGKGFRTLDLFGIEARLQALLLPLFPVSR